MVDHGGLGGESGAAGINKIIKDMLVAPVPDERSRPDPGTADWGGPAASKPGVGDLDLDEAHAPGGHHQGTRPATPGVPAPGVPTSAPQAPAGQQPSRGPTPPGGPPPPTGRQPATGPQPGPDSIGTRESPMPMPAGPSRRGGGFADLLGRLRDAGLGDQVDSWLGDGPNEPIEPRQVEQAVGGKRLSDMASRAGLSEPEAASGLARVLPGVVSAMTPHGNIPDESAVAERLNRLLG